MKIDLLIKNGMVYQKKENFKLHNVGVRNGKIIFISEPDFDVTAERTIDAAGLYVLPGIIDAHVHFREPAKNPDENETFFSGTSAAAAGGITTVLEMPNSFPCTYNAALLNARKEAISDKAVIDYGLYGAAGSGHYDDIVPLANEGIVSFKTFMHSPPKGREADFEGFTMTTDSELFQGFKQFSQTGLPVAVHAENDDLLNYFINEIKTVGDVSDYKSHILSRNLIVETSAINRAVFFANEFKVPVICCHVSSPESLSIIKRAKQDGIMVYAEMCPHYLLFDESYICRHGPYGKCNPPLRTKDQVEQLWNYIEDGTIDYISSDHSPFFKAFKEKGFENILEAPAGFPGTELLLPLMLDQVNKNRLTLQRLVELMSENPAKVFNLYPTKGSLEIGTDADITIVDLNSKTKVNIDTLHTLARESALIYDGLEIKGLPVYTVVRGHMVAEKGEVHPQTKGWGKLVSPN